MTDHNSGRTRLLPGLHNGLARLSAMNPTVADILTLRCRVSDSVLLDWLDLEQLLPARPCSIETEILRRHWCCTQPSVSRRIARLWDAGLIECRSGGGRYRVRRLGPADSTSALLMNEIPCSAADLPW